MCLSYDYVHGIMFLQMGVAEEEEVEDEDMGVAETYADYMPTKCNYFFALNCFHVLAEPVSVNTCVSLPFQ